MSTETNSRCQLFYLAMRKFDPVAVEFFVEDKKQLQNRVPFSVLNTMEEDVAQLKESFAYGAEILNCPISKI